MCKEEKLYFLMHVLYSLCIFVSVIYYMFKTEISIHIISQMQLRVCYLCIVHRHPFRPAGMMSGKKAIISVQLYIQ